MLGERTEELVALYNDVTRAAVPQLAAIATLTHSRICASLAVPALFALIVLVLLAVVWWILKKG